MVDVSAGDEEGFAGPNHARRVDAKLPVDATTVDKCAVATPEIANDPSSCDERDLRVVAREAFIVAERADGAGAPDPNRSSIDAQWKIPRGRTREDDYDARAGTRDSAP